MQSQVLRKIWPWYISWCNQIWLWIRYKSGNLNRLSIFLAIFWAIQGNLVNFTLLKKKLPIMEMSKMLQNSSKFSILFVGEILRVSLVVIPVYVSMVALQKCQSSMAQNKCIIQLGVIYVPVPPQHQAHWITWVLACHSQSFVNLWLLWYRHWDLMTWSRSLGYGPLL